MNNIKDCIHMNDSRIADLKECQEVWNKAYDVNMNDADEFPWEKDIPCEQINLFIEQLASKKDTNDIRILDFGCGTGRLGRYIEKQWPQYKGKVYYYDISNKALEICRIKFNLPQDHLYVPKIDGKWETTFGDNMFDGIIMWGVFHHLGAELQDRTLRLVKKILSPDGILLMADFNTFDQLFKRNNCRISEITGKSTYAINFHQLLKDDFNIVQTGYFDFEENQKILQVKLGESYLLHGKEYKNRLKTKRKVFYVIAGFSLVGKLKKNVVNDFSNSNFSHFIKYKFPSSLHSPKNNTGEYYDLNPNIAKTMWLHSMGLFEAYDDYRKNKGVFGYSLIDSSFSSLLFHTSLKRYSFIVKSNIKSNNNGICINRLKSIYDNVLSNLFEIELTVPDFLVTSSFVNATNKTEYWDYNTPLLYNRDNSYHKSAITRLHDLGGGTKLFDGNHLEIVFQQLDDSLDSFIENYPELKELRQAILMILLFVYPVSIPFQKKPSISTYAAIVPPAFEMPIMNSSYDDFKELSAAGAIIYTLGDPFSDDSIKIRFLLDVMKWSSAATAKEIAEFTFRMAIKSAKAAIMSRNMSHNLGSHVMFYIKQKLQSVEKIFKDNVLVELVNYESKKEINAIELSNKIKQSIDKLQDQNKDVLGLEMPFLVGLGRFINYLQERQDYIATVATDYIPYKSTINFKDAIYDELKPELRDQRHEKNQTNSVGKKASNLLLGFIAYSEGFDSSNRIELCFEDFNGTGTPNDVPKKLRKLNVALPGGNLGRQAFFSIMENIIRNTAKHDGYLLGSHHLKFRFDIIEDIDSLNNLERWTNQQKCMDWESIIEAYKEHKDDYYYLGITVDLGVDADKKLIDIIGDGLNSDYITKDGKIDDSCKGIKEIRISSAWLRSYQLDSDIPSNEPPAVAIQLNNKRLQYIICLAKPKRIAFISESKDERPLDEFGCQIFDIKKFKEERNRIADFDMIICSSSHYEMIQRYVGSRIYKIDNIDSEVQEYKYIFEECLNNGIKEKSREIAKSEKNSVSKNWSSDELIAHPIEKYIGNIYEKWIKDEFKKTYPTLPKLIINDSKSYENKTLETIEDNNTKSFDSKKVDVDMLIKSDKVECNNTDVLTKDNFDILVYSKHYEGQNDLKRLYQGSLFLEGISGGNSTDRLLRQELWTLEWYVRHMTAALTHVAIFDERIYSSFVKRGASPFADWNEEKWKEWVKDLKEKHPDKFCDNKIEYGFFVDVINKTFKENVSIEQLIETENDSDEYVQIISDSEKINKVITKLQETNVPDDYTTAALFEQKGIWTFTIIVENNKVSIIGYVNGAKRKIATLINENGNTQCVLNSECNNIKFHFITIHQGILDKIYETLKVKDKNTVTNALFNIFSNQLDKKGENGFLPQFVIHSGRSLPNKDDMPQFQPFIQFAALDHAIRDCKYTLTELLLSAHYE